MSRAGASVSCLPTVMFWSSSTPPTVDAYVFTAAGLAVHGQRHRLVHRQPGHAAGDQAEQDQREQADAQWVPDGVPALGSRRGPAPARPAPAAGLPAGAPAGRPASRPRPRRCPWARRPAGLAAPGPGRRPAGPVPPGPVSRSQPARSSRAGAVTVPAGRWPGRVQAPAVPARLVRRPSRRLPTGPVVVEPGGRVPALLAAPGGRRRAVPAGPAASAAGRGPSRPGRPGRASGGPSAWLSRPPSVQRPSCPAACCGAQAASAVPARAAGPAAPAPLGVAGVRAPVCCRRRSPARAPATFHCADGSRQAPSSPQAVSVRSEAGRQRAALSAAARRHGSPAPGTPSAGSGASPARRLLLEPRPRLARRRPLRTVGRPVAPLWIAHSGRMVGSRAMPVTAAPASVAVHMKTGQ